MSFRLSNYQIGFLLASGGVFLFSLKSIFIKLAYLEGMNTDTVLFWRMIIALPFYVAILGWLWCKQPAQKAKAMLLVWRVVAVGFLGYYLASYLDLWGLEFVTAQLERLTLFTYPVMIAVLGALFFGWSLTREIVAALALSYLGILSMYGHEVSVTDFQSTTVGVLLVMGSAISFAFYVLISKPMIDVMGAIWFTTIAMLSSTLFLFGHVWLFSVELSFDLTFAAWVYMSLLAVFSTVIPSYMTMAALERIAPVEMAMLGTVGPVITIALAVIWLGEAFTFWHLLGVVLVLLGVGLISMKK